VFCFQLRAVCVAVDIGKSAIAISCGVPFQDNLPFTVLAFIFSSFVFVTALFTICAVSTLSSVAKSQSHKLSLAVA
jgi:hypothetical protein